MAGIAPVEPFGFAQRIDDGHASILCVYPHGVVQGTWPLAEVPDVLRPTGDDPREAGLTSTDAAEGSIRWLLRVSAGRRLLSVAIAQGAAPTTRLWVASTRPDAFSAEAIARLSAVAVPAAHLLATRVSLEEERDLLQRLGRVGELLPAILRVLDVREMLDRVAATALGCLPSDVLVLRLFDESLAGVRVIATSDVAGVLAPPPPSAPVPLRGHALEFAVTDDHRAHPLPLDEPPPHGDARASLRLPVRFDDRVIGDLCFVSFTPGRFTSADIVVGRRLADHVSAALLQQRLAEERDRAAALQARATNLEVLDGLLATLTGVLDVRDVFDRVSAIAQKVLPHDAMSISELIANGEKVRIHASEGLGQLHEPFDMVLPDPTMAREQWDYRLLDDVRDHPEYARGPGWAAGMRSMLFVSIRMEGRNYGGLNFYSRTVGHFVHDDVLVARRITDHVALALSHRRLADEARRNDELRARTTSLELLDDLLATLADTGDIREVFAAIAGAVRRVLAHDAAALLLRMPDGRHARVHVSCGFSAGDHESAPIPDNLLARSDWDHDIVDDLGQESAPLYTRLSSAGFTSMISVPVRIDGRLGGALTLLANAAGAFKPTDVLVVRRMADRLSVALARDRELAASERANEATARAARLEARVTKLTEELDSRTGYRRVIGTSQQWRQVLTQAAQVAATETTVLLLGESGTGKEVVARFLHRGSARSGGPFVALNCAALPEQLLEAELFGYERGAFTGATQSKPGQLEQAAGGTLFLDEVGEMSPTAQPKFLRVLQEREFQRLGGTRMLRSDARIVAATNRDLHRSISNGQFREDLYYRLNVFAIRLPPLRERRDDILPLSEAFIAEMGRGLGRPPAGISRDARQLLVEYGWPGNVRELRNVLERAAILCDGGLITPEFLALSASPAIARVHETQDSAASALPTGDLHAMERGMIERALQTARFNKSKAAKALGLTRHQLYVRMRKHGFDS